MSTDTDRAESDPPPVAGAPLHCGVDVVAISRIERLLGEFGASFRERVFAPTERDYCEQRPDPPQHYAARWAVKEAFLKAIASETQPVPVIDIEVRRRETEPELALSEAAIEAVETTVTAGKNEQIHTAVSLSHDRSADRAIGQVVLFGGDCRE